MANLKNTADQFLAAGEKLKKFAPVVEVLEFTVQATWMESETPEAIRLLQIKTGK